MKDFNLRGYLSNNRLLESKEYEKEMDDDQDEDAIPYIDGKPAVTEAEGEVTFDQKQKDSETREYKEVAQAVKNAEEVADIYNMLDPEMFKFTESEFEDIFHDWWNNITSYDSIADFSRNGYWDDVHSLYLHLRGYAEPVTQADGSENSIEEALNRDVVKRVNQFIFSMAKKYDYPEESAIYAIVAALQRRMPSGAELIIQNVEEPTGDMTEGSTEEEMSVSKEAGRLKAHPEKDTIEKIQALIDKEKSVNKDDSIAESKALRKLMIDEVVASK